MEQLLTVLLIFFARISDVSLGTIRLIMLTRGHKLIAPFLGFFEILIWLFTVTKVVQNISGIESYIAYAAGFAAGNFIGIKFDDMLKIGFQSLRIITHKKSKVLPGLLRERGFAVTVVKGQGMDGEVSILYTVIPRKRLKEAMKIIKEYHPKAFITIEDVKDYQGGFVSSNSVFPISTIRGVLKRK